MPESTHELFGESAWRVPRVLRVFGGGSKRRVSEEGLKGGSQRRVSEEGLGGGSQRRVWEEGSARHAHRSHAT